MTRLSLIREAARKEADGVAWRGRMERWMDLTWPIKLTFRIEHYETPFGRLSIVKHRHFGRRKPKFWTDR